MDHLMGNVPACFRESGITGGVVFRSYINAGYEQHSRDAEFGPLVCWPGSRKPIFPAQLDVILGPSGIGRNNPPTNVGSTLDSIEQALNRHGVIPFSTPIPGVRCSR
jgi:hypothetical protein